MKLKFILYLFVLLILPVISSAKEIDLRINGIGLNSTLSKVKATFGKPVSEKKTKVNDDECVGRVTFVTLNYTGLRIELMGNEKGKNLRVISMKISSSKWKVGGTIALGATQAQVQNKFGKPFDIQTDTGKEFVIYEQKGDEASANFTFQNGKLIGINWSEFLC